MEAMANASTTDNHHTIWKDYLIYLVEWSKHHADLDFYGMTPACFDEWLYNEYQEGGGFSS